MNLALNSSNINNEWENKELFKMLDTGINDMEAGRELPLEEAFEKISELRYIRRNAKQ